jgi:anti-sigma B factor antagonist
MSGGVRISDRRDGHVTIVDMVGRFSVVTTPGRVKDRIGGLITGGCRSIVLNLADVSYIDSSGLGELVACYLLAERHGCTIKLANLDGRMKDVLVLTRLLSLFESHPSEREAIRSFVPAA